MSLPIFLICCYCTFEVYTSTALQLTPTTSITPKLKKFNEYGKNEIVHNLGVVLPTRQVQIGKKLELQQIGFQIDIQANQDIYAPILKSINTAVESARGLRMLDGSNSESRALMASLNKTAKKMTLIEQKLADISEFRNI